MSEQSDFEGVEIENAFGRKFRFKVGGTYRLLVSYHMPIFGATGRDDYNERVKPLLEPPTEVIELRCDGRIPNPYRDPGNGKYTVIFVPLTPQGKAGVCDILDILEEIA